MGDDAFAVKSAMNEDRFRQVNEALEAGREDRNSLVEFVCECGRLGCTRFMLLTQDEYQAVRASSDRRFVMVDGHQVDEVEVVVERHERYIVVSKIGLAGMVAAEQADTEARPPLEG